MASERPEPAPRVSERVGWIPAGWSPDRPVATLTLLAMVLVVGVVAVLSVPFFLEARQRDLRELGRYLALVGSAAVSNQDASHVVAASEDPAHQEAVERALSQFEKDLFIPSFSPIFAVADREGTLLAPRSRAGSLDLREAVQACGLARIGGPQWVLAGPYPTTSGEQALAWCGPVLNEVGAPVGWVVARALHQRSSSVEGLQRYTLLMAGVYGLLAALAVFSGMRLILGPVREISRAGLRVMRGERPVRVHPTGPPALRALGSTFNAMASAMEAREDEVMARLGLVRSFAGYAAHSIRNPLQTIVLELHLVEDEEDPSERRRHLGVIHDQVQALQDLVQRFLRSPDHLEVRLAQVDLVQVAQSAVEGFSEAARARGGEVTLKGPAALSMLADATLLRTSLENLIHNALEAVPEGTGRVEVQVVPEEDRVWVYVDDNGPGVSERRREVIFDPYVSYRKGGTGFGLSLVRLVMEAHRGRARCEVSPLGGARFTLQIPYTPRDDLADA